MTEGKRSVGSGLTAAVLGAGVAGFDVHRRVDAVAAAAAASSHGHQGFEVSFLRAQMKDGQKGKLFSSIDPQIWMLLRPSSHLFAYPYAVRFQTPC